MLRICTDAQRHRVNTMLRSCVALLRMNPDFAHEGRAAALHTMNKIFPRNLL